MNAARSSSPYWLFRFWQSRRPGVARRFSSARTARSSTAITT